ncbi:hypothetical protein [Dyadobacter psychrotolerans]|uniref:Lipocalin-like domain-containing protein n=1 Tax=Dyadobacter psychrotolerans TaxID=2541721 RepID=A0A4R5E0R9_9BACT|nr:hypothetical protein [Dyadobacter psychrotolerans]TDE18161.1 hypothetical protein E0F88_01040 [Dyadobacter psychrotolerans]
MKNIQIKTLIFCCLVVLLGSCKNKEKEVEPEVDFATEFSGNYYTYTAETGGGTEQLWEVTPIAKNQLKIAFTKNTNATISGETFTLSQKYNLINVVATSKDSFTISETANVEQSNGIPLSQKVEGVGTKVINSAGVQQINIELKRTNSASGIVTKEYLEFKKR